MIAGIKASSIPEWNRRADLVWRQTYDVARDYGHGHYAARRFANEARIQEVIRLAVTAELTTMDQSG